MKGSGPFANIAIREACAEELRSTAGTQVLERKVLAPPLYAWNVAANVEYDAIVGKVGSG
jgi:hypothetical protein